MLPITSPSAVGSYRASSVPVRTTLHDGRVVPYGHSRLGSGVNGVSGRFGARQFRTTAVVHFRPQQAHRKENFSGRLRTALRKTRIQWAPIPVGLGICCLGALQVYRIQRRERHDDVRTERKELEKLGRPKKRERVRPDGPWLVLKVVRWQLFLT